MKNAIVLIDGENFKHKIEEILKQEKIKKGKDMIYIKLGSLINNVFKGYGDINIVEKRYYVAKLHEHKETLKKSKQLIADQRRLKTDLEKQGFNFVLAGHVRAQFVGGDAGAKVIFKEKGVDVKIAVDMVSMACDKKIDIIILCSSDSDLQPAVKEVRDRKVRVIYLGFSINPNQGLIITTDQTVLFRNPEIVEAVSN